MAESGESSQLVTLGPSFSRQDYEVTPDEEQSAQAKSIESAPIPPSNSTPLPKDVFARISAGEVNPNDPKIVAETRDRIYQFIAAEDAEQKANASQTQLETQAKSAAQVTDDAIQEANRSKIKELLGKVKNWFRRIFS